MKTYIEGIDMEEMVKNFKGRCQYEKKIQNNRRGRGKDKKL